MCGIAAIVGNLPAGIAEAALRRMIDAQAHRGPDDEGVVTKQFSHYSLGLGSRRLAIQDLSPLGHQPMRNEGTGDVVAYNGEIYNAPELRCLLQGEGFVFHGHSDTEVLLRAYERWGTGCLDRLRGMFAFALWDACRSRLLIARDHLGIKPLYYSSQSGCFVCASEIRALVKGGVVAHQIDRAGLAGYLAYGGVQEPSTIISGVISLPPGSWREVDSSGRTVGEGTYWKFPHVDEQLRGRSAEELLREGSALLRQAVQRHLLSDVRVGIFLSSGLDSTALLGLSQSLGTHGSEHLDAFTVSFPENPLEDEGASARATASRFGVRYHEYPMDANTAQHWICDALDCMDQPSMDGFNTYIVARAVRELGISVALSGLGGDEIFGGYPLFRRVPQTYRRLSWLAPFPLSCRIGVSRLATIFQDEFAKIKGMELAEQTPGLIGTYFRFRRLVSDRGLARMGLTFDALGLSEDFQARNLRYDGCFIAADPVASVSRLETSFYLRNLLLRDSDVFGMANSLEIRVPFLDRDLVEWAFRLPGDKLLPPKAPLKHLLRRMCMPYYGDAQMQQTKRGFTLPISKWLMGPLRDVMDQGLRTLRESRLVESEGVDSLASMFYRNPQGTAWSRVWALVSLGHWLSTIGRSCAGVASYREADRPLYTVQSVK